MMSYIQNCGRLEGPDITRNYIEAVVACATLPVKRPIVMCHHPRHYAEHKRKSFCQM